jgi:hypothetical protein
MPKYEHINKDEWGRVDLVEADVERTSNAFNYIVFKDQTTGTLYKLTVDNGSISLVEYSPD